MGSCNWFNKIFCLKKVKEDRTKQVKVHSATKKSNGSKGKHVAGDESSGLANGASSQTAGLHSMSTEDIAAIRIQTEFRAYMASKALNRLKGTVRSQALIEARAFKNQPSDTLNHIHFWSKIQAEIKTRRLCMVAEGRARQKKLENQLKLEAKLHELQVEWCGGSETMEEILSRIQQREEASIKRERAMAYAFSHQWRANSSPYFGQAYYDLGKESWGWSWMERWIAVRPWETRVNAQQPIVPKKVHARQGSKDGSIVKQAAMKLVVSTKPPLSNGKVTTEAQK
ncbi:unnamed protein product [Ilex paraguariensis]|uniref:Protein IQ-DOMAIN 1 n=1 Tax=Ilex paraguariensis TaxID=185542 RepID=A0ABC8UPE7_9AQUA